MTAKSKGKNFLEKLSGSPTRSTLVNSNYGLNFPMTNPHGMGIFMIQHTSNKNSQNARILWLVQCTMQMGRYHFLVSADKISQDINKTTPIGHTMPLTLTLT
jgi:hypothetical protein